MSGNMLDWPSRSLTREIPMFASHQPRVSAEPAQRSAPTLTRTATHAVPGVTILIRGATTMLAVVVMTVGCATQRATGSRLARGTDTASSNTVVTADELARLAPQGSLFEALERIRPVMLVARGAVPSVSVDGAPLTDLSILRTIPVSIVREVRLRRLSSNVGHAVISADGQVLLGDVIVVTTSRGSPGSR
jgi:hypothetical protein